MCWDFWPKKIHYVLSFSKAFVVGGDPLPWDGNGKGGEEPSWMVGQNMEVERTETLGKVWWNIKEKSFPGKVGRDWTGIPRPSVAVPSLKVSKAKLDGGWNNLG